MVVVSNGEKEQQLKKLKILGIESFFISHVFPSDTGIFKPDPRIFLLASQQLDVPPQNCLSIGDNLEYDIMPCKSINMKVLLIDRNKKSYPNIPSPRIFSLNDLKVW